MLSYLAFLYQFQIRRFASRQRPKGNGSQKTDYGNASILEYNRVCFNIGGNKYRLVVKINYPYRVISIRFVGTHAEYDTIDVNIV